MKSPTRHLKRLRPAACETVLEPEVRDLLDHIAEDLADEYIRLMKKATDPEQPKPQAHAQADSR